jgi:transcriptional regulator with XRE-family HTH domain
MLELYQNIKKYRIAHEWSQGDLAQRVGYADKSMISRIENGKVDLQLGQIKKFAEVLGVTPGELLGKDGVENDIQLLAIQVADRVLEPYRAERQVSQENGKTIIITKKYTDEEKEIIEKYRTADGAIKCAVKKLLDIEEPKV